MAFVVCRCGVLGDGVKQCGHHRNFLEYKGNCMQRGLWWSLINASSLALTKASYAEEDLMEKPADEFYAMLLDKDSRRNPVLIDQIIHVLVLDRLLFGGFLFIQHRRVMLLIDKNLHYVNHVLNAILIAAQRSPFTRKNRTNRIIEAGLRGDILNAGDILKALGILPNPFLEPGILAILDQFID